MVVVCDDCGRRIQPKLKEELLPDGSAKQEFSCPRCKAVYPVCEITKRGIAIREKIQVCRDKDKLQSLKSKMAREVRRLYRDQVL